jgi:predicted ferric reductase
MAWEVNAVSHPSEHIMEVVLRPLAKPVRVAQGQFVSAAFFEGPHFRDCGEFHPYTISKAAEDGSLSLSVKASGDCTRHIQSLEPGVVVRLQGPYGIFYWTDHRHRKSGSPVASASRHFWPCCIAGRSRRKSI